MTSNLYGGGGGQPYGPYICPNGKFINAFTGSAGYYIDRLSGQCNDGTSLPSAGLGSGGSIYTRYSADGWNSVSGRSGRYVDNFLNAGGSGGDPFSFTCPAGQKIVGYTGNAGSFLDSIKFICGYDENYCVNNLESDYCKNAAISTATLNKACAKSMTDTCINRKDELDESTMINYCKLNRGSDICSCYAPVPNYIDPSIGGLQHCWNNKCSLYGYKPPSMRNAQCPSIKICKQSISAEGENLLSSNVIKQDCSGPVQSTPSGVSGSTPSGTSSKPGSTPSNTTYIDQTKPITTNKQGGQYGQTDPDIPSNSKKSIYLILLVLMIVIVLLMYAFDDDDDEVVISNLKSISS